MELSVENIVEQGLLDMKVETSSSYIIAGKQFSLFLLIKNPFNRPIWISNADVILPSELEKEVVGAENSAERHDNKKIKAESSLPDNCALQPGSTAVYRFVLNVKKSIIFSPAKYNLQFNVNFNFYPNNTSAPTNGNVFSNTTGYSISIKPSVNSIVFGAILGGILGAFARLFKNNPSFNFPSIMTVINMVLVSLILSAVSIVFLARKSDQQSFISVEDFWGGLLIGFFVGFVGTSFFDSTSGAGINNGQFINVKVQPTLPD